MKHNPFQRMRDHSSQVERSSAGRRHGFATDPHTGLGHRRVSPGGHLPSQRATTRMQRPY